MPDVSQAVASMPDPMAKWTPVPDWSIAAITGDGWSAKPALGLSMVLVAGDMSRALAALASGMPELGLWQVASGSDYVVRIGRDKALIVTGRPLEFRAGWNADGWSATPAESAYGVIEIAGAALPNIIAEATAADIEAGSRSASTLFAGVPGLLVRTAPDVTRVHMEVGYMAYLWRWLETRR